MTHLQLDSVLHCDQQNISEFCKFVGGFFTKF